MNYTSQEESFLKVNYPKYGPKYCAVELERKEDAIFAKAKRMGLSRNGNRDKHPSMQKIDPRQFYNIKSEEASYFLGFFWADGYINYKKVNTSNCYKIALEILSDDMDDLWETFSSLGNWARQDRKRGDWRQVASMNTNSKDLFNFLKENDYKDKSSIGPTKILKLIPEHLKPYFWRGFFDGDGSACCSKEGESRWKSIKLYSSIDYDWGEVVSLFRSIGIKTYNISNSINKETGHGNSAVTIQNKKDLKILTDYLLSSKLGLKRKTKSLEDLRERFL